MTSPTLISLRPSCGATLSEVAMSSWVLDVLMHVIKPLCLTEMETRTIRWVNPCNWCLYYICTGSTVCICGGSGEWVGEETLYTSESSSQYTTVLSLPHRSPWSNKYDPPLSDGAVPSDQSSSQSQEVFRRRQTNLLGPETQELHTQVLYIYYSWRVQ